MRITDIVAAAAGALLIAAGLVWFSAVRHGRRSEATLAALVAQRLEIEAEIGRHERRLAALEKDRAVIAGARDPGGAAKPATAASSAAAPAAVPTNPPRMRSTSELIARDSNLEVLELQRQRAVVLLEYGRFFRAQGLSASQIAKFTENWMKWLERDMDLRTAARTQDEAGRRTVAELQQQSKTEYETAQVAVLGAEGYRQLDQYVRTLPLQNIVVRGLAGAAALEGFPLTAHQGAQLLQAAIQASGRTPDATGDQMLRAIDWAALDGLAQHILSPAQFALFTTVAPPSGFSSRWKYQVDAEVVRALQADSVPGSATPKARGPGGG